jgi:hypothetical protein
MLAETWDESQSPVIKKKPLIKPDANEVQPPNDSKTDPTDDKDNDQ